jgi:hypothetical protein
MKNFGIALIVFICCAGCGNRIIWNGSFPDNISPIYYVDTIQIKSPYIVYLDSIPYVVPETSLAKLKNGEELTDKEKILLDKGTHHDGKYVNILARRDIDIKDIPLMHLDGDSDLFSLESFASKFATINGADVQKFLFRPKCFLLVVKAPETAIGELIGDGYHVDLLYSYDYVLAVRPVFSKQDWKIINREDYKMKNGKPTISELGLIKYIRTVIWLKFGI